MPRTGATLTRDEISRYFDLPPDLVDALIAGGQLLCQVRDGEQRVPLDQLEAFFREGLVKVYRAEARLDLPQEKVAEEKTAAEEPAVPQTERRPAIHDITPVEPPPPPARKKPELPELRLSPRWIPRRQVDGIFRETRFTIMQMSSTGLRIRYDEPLAPGDEAKLSFALLNPPQSFVMRARVVWTSVARYEGGDDAAFSISGLRVTEHVDRLQRAIDLLRAAHDLQPDRREPPRFDRVEDRASPPSIEGIGDEEIEMVIQAVQRFAHDPVEANRWYSRGRFALSDEEVRRTAPRRPRDREEVLGIWEFLDRQVDIPKVAGILAWTRAAKTSATT